MAQARLLILDENKSTAETTQTLLANAGYEVVVVATSKEAFERAHKELFDVVYNFLPMPEFDGVVLGGRLKRVYPKAQVVFVPTDCPGSQHQEKHVMRISGGTVLAQVVPYNGNIAQMTETLLKGHFKKAA